MKIFIDPGHGGNSIGAAYRGRKEQDDTLSLCLAVKEILRKVEGIEVMLSREGNTNPSITERCTMANVWGADYFLSVHRNAFAPERAKGVEAWVKSTVKTGGNTYSYAGLFTKALSAVGFSDRGVKKGAPAYADYGVNRLTVMHSCLLEVGFIDSTADNEIFDSAFNEIALAIAQTLCEIVEVPFEKAAAGDTDGDGKITVEDARNAMRKALGLDNSVQNSDYNQDGITDMEDVRSILRKALGMVSGDEKQD